MVQSATIQRITITFPSLDRPVGSAGSLEQAWTITDLFIKAVLPLAAVFGAVFFATESLATAGLATTITTLVALVAKHAFNL